MEIDGSYGEGGGQILRTALSLSSITGRPARIYGIRAKRPSPGLKPQHILSALCAARVTGGALEGVTEGSREVFFSPGPPRPGAYFFDVASVKASAGAAGLVFQTVAPALLFCAARSEVVIKGGTHVRWSPPADYISQVFLPAISAMGVSAVLKNPVKGYYPVGGGEVSAVIEPSKPPLKPLSVLERGSLVRIAITSAVSNLPLSIAQRQLGAARSRLKGLPVEAEGRCSQEPSPSRGTFVFILAEFENVRAGFSALGERGKRAEAVGEEAAAGLSKFLESKGALDPHLADQTVLYMALAAGASSVTVSELTGHLFTNAHVVERFLPVKFAVEGQPGGQGRIEVEGAGLVPPRR